MMRSCKTVCKAMCVMKVICNCLVLLHFEVGSIFLNLKLKDVFSTMFSFILSLSRMLWFEVILINVRIITSLICHFTEKVCDSSFCSSTLL